MDQQIPCIYIVTNKPCGVLYIGVSSNLISRIRQHKQKLMAGFSYRYNTDKLVWYEHHADMYTAITREKQLKKWKRSWKIELIEDANPDWRDLYFELAG